LSSTDVKTPIDPGPQAGRAQIAANDNQLAWPFISFPEGWSGAAIYQPVVDNSGKPLVIPEIAGCGGHSGNDFAGRLGLGRFGVVHGLGLGSFHSNVPADQLIKPRPFMDRLSAFLAINDP
jgi:hypothetical protein